MPDISLCKGNECVLKESCYRFKAQPDHYQYYFAKPPFNSTESDDQPSCDYFWEIKQTTSATIKPNDTNS